MRELEGKIAIVTGGIRGIGRGITEELMQEGASVLAAYFEAEEEAVLAMKELRQKAEEYQVRIEGLHVDISKVAEIERLFDYCEKELGKLDIFIANAGANIPRKPIFEHSEADFDHVCGVNFKGTYFCVKECGLRMNDNGRIVLISSSSVPYPVDGHSVYSPTKAAVEMLAHDAALEYGVRGITVNSVAPGVTLTHMAKDVLSPEFIQEVKEGTPLKKVGLPKDVAQAVVLLCSPKAEWINGQRITANGGSHF